MGIGFLPVRLSDSTNTGRSTTSSSTSGDIACMPKRVPCGRKPRYTVSDLPLPQGGKNAQSWKKAFLPSLLAWAGVHKDPFGLNGELYNVVTQIWLAVFPGVTLEENDVTNLVKVVS